MKTIIIVFCISVISTLPVLANCIDSYHLVRGRTSSEAIKEARQTIPHGFVDNSECTSPIISCQTGFEFSEDGEFCVNENNEANPVSANISIKRASAI
jgi:hypothetical protein